MYGCFAELSPVATRNDATSQDMRDQLQAVTNSQYRHSGLKNLRRKGRASRTANGIGAPGKNQAGRAFGPYLFKGLIIGNNLAIHGQFSNPTCDQLCVLRTKIQNENIFAVNELAPGYNWLYFADFLKYRSILSNSTERNEKVLPPRFNWQCLRFPEVELIFRAH
jgi:hypothetical protein